MDSTKNKNFFLTPTANFLQKKFRRMPYHEKKIKKFRREAGYEVGVPHRGVVPSFPTVPQNVGRSIMTVTIWAKLGSQGMKAGTERQKKYLIFRGVAGCPVVLLPFCLSGFLSMCKKMAHSAQLNIKVDPPFFGWLSLVGCRWVFLAFASSFGLSFVLPTFRRWPSSGWPGFIYRAACRVGWWCRWIGGRAWVSVFLFRCYLNLYTKRLNINTLSD